MAVTVKAKDTRALVLQKSLSDFSAVTFGDTSTSTSTTFSSALNLAFTPASSREYLIIASCEVNYTSTASTAEVRLNDGTTQYNTALIQPQNTADYRPWQCILKVTLSGSQSWDIEYRVTSSGTVKLGFPSIIAIDLSTFPNNYYNRNATFGTPSPPGTWTDVGASLTQTTRAGDHLLIAGSHCRNASGNVNAEGEVQLLYNAASLGNMTYRSASSASDYWVYGCIYKVTLTAASHTFKFQTRKVGSGPGGIPAVGDSTIALIELDPTVIATIPKPQLIIPKRPLPFINKSITIIPPYQEPAVVSVPLIKYPKAIIPKQLLPFLNKTITVIPPYQESVTVPFTPGSMTFYPSVGRPPFAPDPIVPVNVVVPLDQLWATASPFNPYGIVEHHTKFRPPVGNKFGVAGQYIGTSEPVSPILDDCVVKTTNVNYTLTEKDELVLATAAITLTLPTAAGIKGKVYIIKNLISGTITIDTDGSETIDGSNGTYLTVQYQTITIISDGTNWNII